MNDSSDRASRTRVLSISFDNFGCYVQFSRQPHGMSLVSTRPAERPFWRVGLKSSAKSRIQGFPANYWRFSPENPGLSSLISDFRSHRNRIGWRPNRYESGQVAFRGCTSPLLNFLFTFVGTCNARTPRCQPCRARRCGFVLRSGSPRRWRPAPRRCRRRRSAPMGRTIRS